MDAATPTLTIEEFKALTPAQQRVAVAKDILVQLDLRAYSAHGGVYICGLGFEPPRETDLRDELLNNLRPGAECMACMKGALFLSQVRLGNDFKTPALGNLSILAECALEGSCTGPFTIWGDYATDLEDWFERWGNDSYPARWYELGDEERMRELAQNIINNDGEFCPEQIR